MKMLIHCHMDYYDVTAVTVIWVPGHVSCIVCVTEIMDKNETVFLYYASKPQRVERLTFLYPAYR